MTKLDHLADAATCAQRAESAMGDSKDRTHDEPTKLLWSTRSAAYASLAVYHLLAADRLENSSDRHGDR